MYDTCHINGTWGSKEVGQLKLLDEGGKPQSGSISKPKSKVKVNNNFIKSKE